MSLPPLKKKGGGRFQAASGGSFSVGLSQTSVSVVAGDYAYVTANPTGGTAPYTTVWSHNSTSDKIIYSEPNQATGWFSLANPLGRRVTLSPVVPETGIIVTATVTDNLGAVATQQIAVTCTAPATVDPALPTTTVDNTYPTLTGTVRGPFTTWATIQAAIDTAVFGDTILIGANGGVPIQLGSPLQLKLKAGSGGGGWIIIKGDVSLASCPQGTTMTQALAGSIGLPKLQCITNNSPAFTTTNNDGTNHYRIVGLDIGVSPTAKPAINTLVQIGATASYDNGAVTVAEQPHHIIVDRCYVHGLSYTEAGNQRVYVRHGIGMHGAHIAAFDSTIDECNDNDSDSQAIFGLNGSGPYMVHNCLLGAGGEVIMFGGGDPRADALNPADITITHNRLRKKYSWAAEGWIDIKNLFELKNARRVLVEGNIMENTWAGAQVGDGILLQTISNDNTLDSPSIQDITIRYNIIRNCVRAVTLSGRVSEGAMVTRQTTQRVLVEHNLFESIYDLAGVGTLQNGLMGAGQIALHVRHNTFIPGGTIQSTGPANLPKGHNLRFNDNIMSLGTYGWFADGGFQGTAALNQGWHTWQATGNLLFDAAGGSWGGSGAYPAGNSFANGNYTTIGFTNPVTGGNWSLAAATPYKGTASDGTDPGVDWAAVVAATAGVP